MPIYEYACMSCGEIFSAFQSITASEKDTRCPKCGSPEVKKQLSSFSCCSSGNSSSSFSGGFGGGCGGGAPSFGGG